MPECGECKQEKPVSEICHYSDSGQCWACFLYEKLGATGDSYDFYRAYLQPEYGEELKKRKRQQERNQWQQERSAWRKHRKRVHKQRRRARKRALPATFTPRHWQLALEYFNGCCAVCGRKADLFIELQQDHWIPLSSPNCLGTVPENIVPLCANRQTIEGQSLGCNQSKHNKRPEKWLIQRYGNQKAQEIIQRIETFFEWIRQQ